MTPAANASNLRLRFCFICPRTKNTQAAPRTVPRNGMVRPWIMGKIGWFIFMPFYNLIFYSIWSWSSFIFSAYKNALSAKWIHLQNDACTLLQN